MVSYDKTIPFLNEVTRNVDDMSSVEDINEVDLLNNLKNRFFSKNIFTNVGQTLIVTNPYQRLEGVFGEQIISDIIKVNIKLINRVEKIDLVILGKKNLILIYLI